MFWKRHTGGPLSLGPMIQNSILPQIGLAQENIKNKAIQKTNCVLETPYRGPIVFGSHDPKYHSTSDWLGPGKQMPYKEATVFWKRHTGNPVWLDPMIQYIILHQICLAHDRTRNNAIHGGHCIMETPYRETIEFGSHDPTYYITSVMGSWIGDTECLYRISLSMIKKTLQNGMIASEHILIDFQCRTL